MSDEHMWLIPFTEGQDHLLTIDLGHTTPLVGIRVWNYNKSTDDSFRGVREITMVDLRNWGVFFKFVVCNQGQSSFGLSLPLFLRTVSF